MIRNARVLADRCRRKAQEIDDASRRVREEQERREADRRRWEWENWQEEYRRARGYD